MCAIVIEGGLRGVRKLLEGQATNVNAEDDRGRTALHIAAFAGDADTVEVLLNHGADINVTTNDEQRATPLYKAVDSGSRDTVAVLLNHGADIHAGSISDTPLHRAAASEPDTVEILLNHGADIHARGVIAPTT